MDNLLNIVNHIIISKAFDLKKDLLHGNQKWLKNSQIERLRGVSSVKA
jgi:hypothetical protein